MWVFYYAMYGPGHQSTDSDFEYFADGYDEESIEESLTNKFRDQWDLILEWWKVDKPTKQAVRLKIASTKAALETYTEYLKIMEKEKSFTSNVRDGADEVFRRNIKGKVYSDVLRRLHKAGYMYTERDLGEWRWGRDWAIPVEPDRSKILRIIRRSKSYPR